MAGIGGDNVGNAYVKIHADGQGLDKEVADQFDSAGDGIDKKGEEHADEYSKGLRKGLKRNRKKNREEALDSVDVDTSRLRRISARLSASFIKNLSGMNKSLDDTAPRIGKLFGKGARNDFVNFFGAGIEGASRLTFMVPKLLEKFLGLGKTVKGLAGTFKEFRSAGLGVFTSLGKTLGGAASGSSALFSSLAAGAVAIPIVIVVMGALVSVVSLLLGTLVALASTISFALVGAFGVLLGTIAPVVAAVGVITAGILALSDAQKKALKEAIRPFTNEMRTLGQIAGKELFRDAPEQAGRLGAAFKGLRPLVKGVAREIRQTGDGFIDALEGPGFKRFKAEMTDFLPRAVGKLGRAFGNTIGGFGGLFVALIPATDRFLTSVEKVTAKFAKFTNSVEGQNKIKDFMDDALESAKALGEFAGQLGGLLGDLLFNSTGKDVGDSLFKGLANSIRDFRKYIEDGKLEQWFKDSKEFAQDLGGALKKLGEILDALDSPGFRRFASLMVKVFSEIFETAANLLRPIGNLIDAFNDLFNLNFSGFIGNLGKFGLNAAKALLDGITFGFGDEIIGLTKFLTDKIGGAVKSAVGTANDALSSINGDSFQGLLDGLKEVNETGKETSGRSFFTGLIRELNIAAAAVDTTDADLRKLFGLPPIKTKYDASEVRNAGRAADNALKSLQNLFNFGKNGTKINMDSTKVHASRLATLQAKLAMEQTFGLATKGTKIQIDAEEARTARALVSDLGNLLSSLFPGGRRNLTINTKYTQTGSPSNPRQADGGGIATGGIVDLNGLHRSKKMAFGGIANFAQRYQIAEAGSREAIVPLNRPLGQVDPSVRLLSAFAQGKLGGDTYSKDKTIDASGWIIQSNAEDPRAVARETVNRLADAVM